MKLGKQIVIIICILATGMFSCSKQATIPSQVAYIPSPISSDLDSLISSSEINLSFYERKPVEVYAPKLAINGDFDKNEQTIVKLTDATLFEKNLELVIDFSKMLADDAFKFPLPGGRVISPYGTRRGRRHEGIDIKIDKNNTIFAAFDGVVRVANTGRGYGNVIVIRHYNGLETVYSHNSKNLVKSGDRVNAGDTIAVTGQTGRATTDHLHFEVRMNGQHFDPNIIIDFNRQTLHHKCLVFSGEKGHLQIEQV